MEENKIYFNDFFDVSRTIIEDYGAMDISLLNDLPLFIDELYTIIFPMKWRIQKRCCTTD